MGALNGYIHPISDMMVYEEWVPKGVLNERIRIDFTALIPEMMSASLRCPTYEEVKALNDGVSGKDGNLSGDYVRIPTDFSPEHLILYNGENTRLLYLPGASGWFNYQGDEFDLDMAMSVGGDGTFLRTAARVNRQEIPILGINAGRLGFLADVSNQALEETLDEIFKHYYKVEERTLAAAPSEATFAISWSTIILTSSSNVVVFGFQPNFAFAATMVTLRIIVSVPRDRYNAT